ncbi:MAG: substrate-binding domain-containing protein [Hyphomicrobiales bacterium]|nr:substrate-binding domain-containing protein [Alphaproteobacteria bacterium]
MKHLRGMVALLAMLAAAAPAGAAELKIFGSRVTKVIVGELGPQFEKSTGATPVVVADVAAVMKRRIEAGEPFDLAVLVNFQIDELIKKGLLRADSRADIMSSGIGVAVKRGARKPDIGSVAAFKQAMLDAKSVTYLKEGASTIHLRKLFVELGIADAIKAKAVETDGETVSELVADGKVELGLIVIPNIMSVPGAELVGPLPAAINSVVMFTAGISAASSNQAAARALIELLKSPAAKPVIQAKGNDPA